MNGIHPIIDRAQLQRNLAAFFAAHRSLIAVFLIAILCDSLTTIHFMHRIGVEEELHPAVRHVSIWFGPVVGPLIGFVAKAMAGALIACYLRRWAVAILTAATVASFAAAIWNLSFDYLLRLWNGPWW